MIEVFKLDVVYALPDSATVIAVEAQEGDTIEQLVERSGIVQRHPEIDPKQNKVGIYSRQVKWDYQIQKGDRIEIYRPLIADPKEVRKRRAEQAKDKRS